MRAQSSTAVLSVLLLLFVASPGWVAAQSEDILVEAQKLSPWLQSTRRELHKIPEVAFTEEKTSALLRAKLTELGIPFTYPHAKTGIVGTIGSGLPKVAIRTDIDALPIEEEIESEFRSTHAGRMHACGHDGHMAMLLGAARMLKEREAQLGGTVLLVFQPAEEKGGGGNVMVQEGVLEGVSALFALHNWPTLPAGVIGTKDGTIMAAAVFFRILVQGRGGHGAMPHLTHDPVVAGTAVVTALQPLVSRETSPVDSAVITVARFNTGPGAPNVIPDDVELTGTLRALTFESFERLQQRIKEVAVGAARMHGCQATVEWEDVPYPPTVNAPEIVTLVEAAAKKLAGPSKFARVPEPSMAGEDFGFMSAVVPGAMAWLGIGNASIGTTAGLHTARYQMDESQLPLGAALHATMALDMLARAKAGAVPSSGHSEL